MALQPQVGALPLFGGIDTKTDKKFVAQDKLITAQNVVFPGIQASRKRYGQMQYPTTIVGGGNISTGASVGVFNDEVVLFDGATMYTYSTSLSAWVRKASMFEIDIDVRPVATDNVALNNPVVAATDGVELHAWDDGTSIHYVVKDQASGSYLVGATTLVTATRPRVAASNDYLFLFYEVGSTVFVRALPAGSPTDGFGAAFSLATIDSTYSWAVGVSENDPTRLNFCYISGALIYYTKVQANGFPVIVESRTRSVTTSPATEIVEVKDSLTPTFPGRCYALLYQNDVAADAAVYRMYLDSPNGPYDIPAPGPTWTYTTKSAPPAGSPISSAPQSGGVAFLYQTIGYSGAGLTVDGVTADTWLDRTSCVAWTWIDNDGNFEADLPADVADISYQDNVILSSTVALRDSATPFAIVSTPYRWLQASAVVTGQATYYVMTTGECRLSLRLLSGKAYRPGRVLPALFVTDTDAFQVDLPTVSILDTNEDGNIYALTAITSVYGEFATPARATILPFGTTALISCGNTYSYDGASVVENGFWQFPGGITTTQSNTGGSLGGASESVYTYQFAWEWTDVAGNLHISAPSFPVYVTFTAGVTTGSVKFAVPQLFTTLKSGIQLGVYRSAANSSVPLYREQTINVDPTDAFVGVTSTAADSTILGNLPLYTAGGLGEVENEPAPAFKYVTATKNRIFGVPQDDPYTLWYSKNVTPGAPAEFSQLFVTNVESAGGIPTALSYIDTQAVLFKQERIYYLPGDGPDSTGQPVNGFAPLQLISTVTGCSQPQTCLPTSLGLFFRSSTTMALLDRSLSLNQNIGLPVQGLNNLVLRGGSIVPEQNQLRWVSEQGTGLIYDFLLNRWSTFTNYDGVGCCTTSTGTFLRATDTGIVWYEDPTTYLDQGSPVVMKIGTPWFKPGQAQGFMAVWEALILGQYQTSHSLQVDIYYDYQEYPTFSLTWDPSGALNVSVYGSESPYGSTAYYGSTVANSPAYQCRVTPPRQMCQAIRFDVYDTGITGESCTLSEIELKFGVVGGLNRTGALQTI